MCVCMDFYFCQRVWRGVIGHICDFVEGIGCVEYGNQRELGRLRLEVQKKQQYQRNSSIQNLKQLNRKKQRRLQNKMVGFDSVQNAFNRVGLNQNDLVTQGQILQALDRLAQNNGFSKYDREIADQLWGETSKQVGNKVYVRDYINTIMKGKALVKSSIDDLEKQIQYKTDPHERNEILQNISSYTRDMHFLTVPFGGQAPRQSQVLASSHYQTPAHNQSRYSGHSTVIFSKQLPEKQSGSSTDLKFAFLITCILTFVEILVMFHKHHFFSLLAYLSVFAIFFLGYFDLHYMRFVKLVLLVSVLLDFVWIVVNGAQYWNPVAETQHSSLQWAFLKFIIFFVVGMDISKIILIAILFKYRNNPSNLRKSVQLCGQKYNLSARPSSLLAQVVNGSQVQDQGYEGTYNDRNRLDTEQ